MGRAQSRKAAQHLQPASAPGEDLALWGGAGLARLNAQGQV